MFFIINGLEDIMKTNRNWQFVMKGISLLVVLVIGFFSINQPNTMKIVHILSIPIICLFFGIEVHLIKQNKKIEFRIYELEKRTLMEKKRDAEIRGETLPVHLLNCEITKPSEKISLPILFYVSLIILDIMIKFFAIH